MVRIPSSPWTILATNHPPPGALYLIEILRTQTGRRYGSSQIKTEVRQREERGLVSFLTADHAGVHVLS